ncbi:hypothetical protein CHU92_02380 [Flavobacterium cyanobacteriorum]|uniref:GLPGLI family protein n=1 Tax=Flavobacterium cyanobacteriorum TaxID=2022802 RepID=A0A255ZTF4_9FLAO|nr:hypothetical protein [Flavobacterium cyanobacteriorum]OYQ44783.1 hypothetical protein CHU92_02380 [Flavobacterium cyanobacteriorum]
MKLLLTTILFLFCFHNLEASPQLPDYLIVGNDTLSIYFLPLNKLDSITQKKLFRNLELNNEFKTSFNLWRGYQAYWKLENNKLFLTGFKDNPHSESILEATFRGKYENRKVFADWFSSYLAVGKDKLLKWDGIFSRTYLKEELFEFEKGELKSRSLIENYIKIPNGISRLEDNRKLITDTIFSKIKKLDWKKLSECECDDKYWVIINDIGKISNIIFVPNGENDKETKQFAKEHKKCIKKIMEQTKDLQFDIIKWNGKPYEQKIQFEIFYTVEGKLENWSE